MIDPNAVTVTNPDLLNQIVQLNTAAKQIAEALGHLTTGGMTAYVIQWAKGKPNIAKVWTALTDRAKTVVTALLAAASGAGIVVTFTHPGNGHWILDIDHLTLATFGLFVWAFVQNWFWQTVTYTSALKPKAVVGPAEPQPQPPVPVTVQGVKP